MIILVKLYQDESARRRAMMIKVTDWIIKWLEDYGVKYIFMVVGGGSIHINDSIGKSTKIKYICMHHEQACAMAAEGYARASGKLGVVCVTTGPGATNTLTGILGQWVDSVPVLYLAGQVMQATSMDRVKGLRQLGDQEAPTIDIVKPITKYAVSITKPRQILTELPKAVKLATNGRPAPVWIELPYDIQESECIIK